METKKDNSLFRSLLRFGIGPIGGMCINIITVPLTTRLIAVEEYGKVSLFTLIQTVFSLFILLGMDQAYTRFYNDYKNKKRELLFTSMIIPFCLVIIVLVCVFLFQDTFSLFLFGSVEKELIYLILLYIPALLFYQFSLLSIRMELRGKTYSLLTICQSCFNLLFLILFLTKFEKSFRSVVLSQVLSTILTTFFAFLLSGLFIPFERTKINYSLLKELLCFGLPLVPAALLSWVMNSFDKVALRNLSSFTELGRYGAAFKIVSILSSIQAIFTTAWAPVALKWNDEKRDIKDFDDVSTIVTYVMVIFFSGIITFREIIMLFVGPEYRDISDILVFLLFVPVLYTISETSCLGIIFSKKSVYSLFVSLIAAIANIFGNSFLIPVYGALGAAISTALSYSLFFIFRTVFSNILGFKVKTGKFFICFSILAAFCVNMLFIKSKLIEFVLFMFIGIIGSIRCFPIIKKNLHNTTDSIVKQE